MSKRIVTHLGIEYEVPEKFIESIEKNGVIFNNEYISYLFENSSPLSSKDLSFLIYLDIRNLKYIGSKGSLGRIVHLSKKGEAVSYFETVYDAVLDSLNHTDKYTFEKIHKEGILLKKKTYLFFGLRISVMRNVCESQTVNALNRVIRKCKNRYMDNDESFKSWYSDKVAELMSYDEYILRGTRWKAFLLGQEIHDMQKPLFESKYTEHHPDKCDDYCERMVSLLMRYSLDDFSAFEQVMDLNDVSKFSGIYVLCLPEIKGCYVGQTKTGFASRIPQHFTKPNSEFDKKYTPDDVQQIFVLPMDETMDMVDLVEEDCIATLGKEICLNALAGGSSIEFIKSDKYEESKHFLSQDRINWVVEDSKNITEYVRDCEEIENMYSD